MTLECEYEVTAEGTVKAFYPVMLDDDENNEAHIQFHLTYEGIIVDVFDHNGELVATFANTAQEFADRLTQ